MLLNARTPYVGKLSIVCHPSVASRQNIQTVYNNFLNNLRGANIVDVVQANDATWIWQHHVDNIISPDSEQIDMIVRFTPRSNINSQQIDDIYALSWNTALPEGAPRLPGSANNRGGDLFQYCSRQNTLERQGNTILGFAAPWSTFNYEQLCSEYAPLRNVNQTNVVVNGGIIDRLSSNRISAAYPAANLVGTNPNQSTTVQELANDYASQASRSINEFLGNTEVGSGMSANDFRFLMYSGVTIFGLLVGARLLREVRKV